MHYRKMRGFKSHLRHTFFFGFALPIFFQFSYFHPPKLPGNTIGSGKFLGLVSESDFTRTTPTDNCPTCPSESIFEKSDNTDICRTFVRVSDLSDRPRIVRQIGGQSSIRALFVFSFRLTACLKLLKTHAEFLFLKKAIEVGHANFFFGQ